jgi:hypothetical protein
MTVSSIQTFNFFDLDSLEDANQEVQSFLEKPEYQNKSIKYSISYSKYGNREEESQTISLEITVEG